MNKLGLAGLFAAGAMILINVQKQSNDNRDKNIMNLAQALYDEDFARTRTALMTLASDYGHQPLVRECLVSGLDDARDIFGDARALPLLQQVQQRTNSQVLRQIMLHVCKHFEDRSNSQARAHKKAVLVMSDFLHRSGLPQMNFDEGSVGVKRRAVALRGEYLTPEQFLNRNKAPTVAALVQKISYRAG